MAYQTICFLYFGIVFESSSPYSALRETASNHVGFLQKHLQPKPFLYIFFFGPWSKHERCNVHCKSAIYIQTCNFQKCKMYTFECAFVVNMHFSYYTKNTLKSALCTFQNCSFECKLHFKSKFCIFEKCTFECRLGFRSAIFMCSFCFKTPMLVMCFLWDCVFAKKTCVDCLRSCCSFPNPMCRFAEFRVLLSFIFMHIGAEQRLSVGLPKMVNSRLVGVLFSMFWGAKTR